jgi:hypothetical protein
MRRLPLIVLAFMALTNLVRGGIHVFAPDGGAHSIAGLDLSTNGQTILSLFAIVGLQQIVLGLFEAFVVFRRRDLVLLALGLQTAQTALGVLNLDLYRPMPVHVPGATFNTGILVVLVLTLAVALFTREKAAA